MKKNLFFVALAAVALVSCSSEDVVDEIVENEVAINFEGLTNKSTRAEITSPKDLATEGGFVVYGYKAKTQETMNWATGAYTVFDGVNIYAKTGEDGAYIDGDQTDWTYASKKYWDKNATYCFYAVAPFGPTSGATYGVTDVANNARMITITGATSGLASASDDHLIDRDGVKNRPGTTTTNVDFEFHHVMAKIDFKLVKASGVTGVLKVKNITMTGWNGAKGNFVQSTTTNPTTLDKSEWTLQTGSSEYPAAGNVVVLNSTDGETVTTVNTYNTNTYIMVPQEIADGALTFTIDYTIDDEPFNAHVGTVSGVQTWGTDSHTTYTLTIGPATIEFDVKSVCGFDVTGTGGATVN